MQGAPLTLTKLSDTLRGGWLLKESHDGFKSWSDRYFVLDMKDKKLSYYDNEDKAAFKGEWDLADSNSSVEFAKDRGGFILRGIYNVFVVRGLRSPDAILTDLFLSAASIELRDEWIKAITDTILGVNFINMEAGDVVSVETGASYPLTQLSFHSSIENQDASIMGSLIKEINSTEGQIENPIDDDIMSFVSSANVDRKRISVGYYRLSSERQYVRYAYVPRKLMSSASFNLDDVFAALDIATPNLIFEINNCDEIENWNVKLPPYKKDLAGADHPARDKNIYHGGLKHYQGVVEENCKRLFKGTVTACNQANAIFRSDGVYSLNEGRDQVAEWISDAGGNSVMLAIVDFDDYDFESVTKKMITNSISFIDAVDGEGDDNMYFKNAFVVDTSEWYRKENPRKHGFDDKGKPMFSIPINNLTHVVLTDDYPRFDEILNKVIPAGLIVVNGSAYTTAKFCEAIQEGMPIFIFKYTGSTADLACECLKNVDKMLQQKRLNPAARPVLPFLSDFPSNYVHPSFLWNFSEDDKDVCRYLNILIENFPDRYNPASVLQIDMFTTSEERLQDQLTKTMSVVFEGVAELGGQSAESRRLTYAWRLRYLLYFNSSRHKRIADILQALIIIFAFLSTTSSVLYNYFGALGSDHADIIYILKMLSFILPLVNTLFNGINAALGPGVKASILKIAAVKVESEIYMYRTKVGPYSMRGQNNQKKDSSTSKKDKGKDENKKQKQVALNPRKVLSNALETIWTDLAASDISKGALVNPSVQDDPLKDVNDRIMVNRDAQSLLMDGFKQKKHNGDDISDTDDSLGFFGRICSCFTCCSSWFRFKSSTLLKPDRNQETKLELNNITHSTNVPLHDDKLVSGDADEEGIGYDEMSLGAIYPPTSNITSPSDERTINTFQERRLSLRLKKDEDSHSQTSATHAFRGFDHASNDFLNSDKLGKVIDLDENIQDDGLSSITADEYVRMRLIPMLAEYTNKAPVLSQHISFLTLITIFLSVSSSIFAVFDLTTLIPLIFAFSGSLSYWQTHNMTGLRLMQTNSSVHQLHQLLIWWDSLSMIEKRVAVNKEQLVLTTEAAVQGQMMTHSSSSVNRGNNNSDDES